MLEQFIAVPDGQVWCGIAGHDTSGIPLLALHGGPGAPHDYLEPLLALADCRPVIFYDQLGCGKSPASPGREWWTVEHFTAELHEIVARLELKRFHLLGQSWGAFLAVAYWLRYRPVEVRSLILCGPCLSVPRWIADQQEYLRQMPESHREVIDRSEAAGDYDHPEYQAAVDEYFKRHVCRLDPWPEPFVRTLEGFNIEQYHYLWGPSEFTANGILRDEDLVPQLPSVSLPVLLTCGEYDEAVPATLYDYAAAFPDARVRVFGQASHLHHLEQPEAFIGAVRDFLEQAEAQRDPG